ncbi:DgyrCDS13801 [Dimorphilus gyrociliatus]|uniref:DgyrCDS13801 n=1 Tax=Dimorphilus gyrociliatus TaxID=2664684 RepID=A0A7I8WBS7_9ANNE|nr:DgyrCDS13801 [Dimorphilus gyrociliatus]
MCFSLVSKALLCFSFITVIRGEHPFDRVINSLRNENITNFQENIITDSMLEIILHRYFNRLNCEENLSKICQNCLKKEEILQYFNKTFLEEQDFDKFAAIILQTSLTFPNLCNATNNKKKAEFDTSKSIFTEKLDSDSKVYKLVDELAKKLKEDGADHDEEHDEEHNEEHDEGAHEHEGEHKHEQDCFNVDILLYKANSGSISSRPVVISSTLTSYLLSKLQYKPKNCSIENKTLPFPTEFSSAIFEHFGKQAHESIDLSNFKHITEKLEIGNAANKSTEEPGHEGHDHRRRRKRSVHEEPKINSICYSSSDLLKIFQFKDKVNREQLEKICPALIHQQMFGSCKKPIEQKVVKEPPTRAEKYGYTMLAVFIVSICALFGIVLRPCYKFSHFEVILSTLVASGFGVLVTDSLLHLMPEAFGMHDHEHEGGDVVLEPYTQKALGILAAIYFFFILELVIVAISSSRKENSNDIDISMREKGKTNEQHSHDHHRHSTSIMIVIGDGVHNFADGLIIGAAFSLSTTSGISTTIAVFIHELAHEFGDLALLVDCGLSLKKALLLNGLSALSCFVGGIVGVALAVDESVRQWIFAVAGGMFLYIALVNMIGQLGRNLQKYSRKVLFIVIVNMGALIGIAALTLLAVYESKISV